jgi:flagellar hook assembly protein FlgD
VVKTFLDGQSSLQAEFAWDGKSDDGKQQPIGIYIVYFEAVGVESTKTTVVIAR